jgi:hypothetical protein
MWQQYFLFFWILIRDKEFIGIHTRVGSCNSINLRGGIISNKLKPHGIVIPE